MMINNIKKILGFVYFESDDDFYFMQVIQRRKENPDIGSDNIVIKSFYCTHKNFERNINDAIKYACYFNARVYFHLNRKSFKQVGLLMLKNVSEHIYNDSSPAIKNAFDSACGQFVSNDLKYWIVDVDTKDEILLNEIISDIQHCNPDGNKIVSIIPTKNGNHIITKPFNVKQFQNLHIKTIPDIHKNNPTLLYCPG